MRATLLPAALLPWAVGARPAEPLATKTAASEYLWTPGGRSAAQHRVGARLLASSRVGDTPVYDIRLTVSGGAETFDTRPVDILLATDPREGQGSPFVRPSAQLMPGCDRDTLAVPLRVLDGVYLTLVVTSEETGEASRVTFFFRDGEMLLYPDDAGGGVPAAPGDAMAIVAAGAHAPDAEEERSWIADHKVAFGIILVSMILVVAVLGLNILEFIHWPRH